MPGAEWPLDVQQITAELGVGARQKWLKPTSIIVPDRGVAGDVAAEIALAAIGPHDRCHRVPTHVRANPLLERSVAW